VPVRASKGRQGDWPGDGSKTANGKPGASLPASLSAQQSALHTCPVIQATPSDLDIREDSGCLPVAQSPAADWQFCQQLLFVHESPLVTRISG